MGVLCDREGSHGGGTRKGVIGMEKEEDGLWTRELVDQGKVNVIDGQLPQNGDGTGCGLAGALDLI